MDSANRAARPAPAQSRSPEIADEEVARRVVAGETALYELLMRRHNQRLFRVARGVVDSDAEAEDVLQEAWLSAYEHLADFRGEAKLSTWLSKIALHEAFARGRRRRRFLTIEGSDADGDSAHEPATGDPSPDRMAWTAELRAALERAVAALPPHYRSVFLMREIEWLSTADTAASLELTEEVVRVRLHRARSRLRADLEQRLGEVGGTIFAFAGDRCDRVVAAVLPRLAER